MDDPIPKLKIMGLAKFVAVAIQIASLFTCWFTAGETKFSIRGLSHSYLEEVMIGDCSTIEQFGKFLCFCGDVCREISGIHDQGWGCAVVLLLSVNLFLSEIFVIRRKIWRLEGLNLTLSFIDKDLFLVAGVIVHNFGIMYWLFLVSHIEVIKLSTGFFLTVFVYFINLATLLHYFFKIRPTILRH